MYDFLSPFFITPSNEERKMLLAMPRALSGQYGKSTAGWVFFIVLATSLLCSSKGVFILKIHNDKKILAQMKFYSNLQIIAQAEKLCDRTTLSLNLSYQP